MAIEELVRQVHLPISKMVFGILNLFYSSLRHSLCD